MKKLLYIFLLIPLFSTAQNFTGAVFSVNNDALENVNISAISSKTGSITNKNGEFSITILSKFKSDEILEFSHLGYITARFSINYLKSQNFKIHLQENVENLSGLTIISNLKLKPKLEFSVLKNLRYPIYSFGSFLKDDKIYVSGGDPFPDINYLEKGRSERADYTLTDYLARAEYTYAKPHYKKFLLTYDIKNNLWETAMLKLKPRAYHNMLYYKNSIYILGGKKILVNSISSWEYLEDNIEVVDIDSLNTKNIQVDKTNPHQAVDFASFSYKDNIVVLGGSVNTTEDGKKSFTNKVHLYNITSGYWYELENMPIAKETSGVLIDDKIYLIGGNNGKPTTQIETFDLITEKWQIEGESFSGLERPAVTYNDRMIYFFENRKMYTYDTKTTQLKEYDIEIELKHTAMFYHNNKLYILGGRFENSYSKIPSGQLFCIDLEEFKTTKPMKAKYLSQQTTLAKAD